MSGSLVGDRNAYMRSQAAKDASTPFTRFADSMTRQAADLSQTPDGQRYNELRYATTDPSKSALLSPVRDHPRRAAIASLDGGNGDDRLPHARRGGEGL
jgi:hypothetical protein